MVTRKSSRFFGRSRVRLLTTSHSFSTDSATISVARGSSPRLTSSLELGGFGLLMRPPGGGGQMFSSPSRAARPSPWPSLSTHAPAVVEYRYRGVAGRARKLVAGLLPQHKKPPAR